jgi:hypothetical protein
MLQEHELTLTIVIFHRSPVVHNQRAMLASQAGTATYFASHLHSNRSPSNSELLNNHNSHKRLNLPSSNSNNNSSSKEYHPRPCPNNQQINKMSNKPSSQRQISQAVAVTSSRHSVYVPTASCSNRRTATVA